MLELGKSLESDYRVEFVSFSEDRLCHPFLDEVENNGFRGIELAHDTPHLLAAYRELVRLLRNNDTNILCCHGYKAGLLGLLAARRLRIPVIGVSRGWTAESRRVKLYEKLDRLLLRRMDRVVCVSHGQAEKVRRAGVADKKITVIHNAIRTERFGNPKLECRARLEDLFPKPPKTIVAAAGRLSPEKGFDVLIDAAAEVVRENSSVGFVLFGDGALRDQLGEQINALGLGENFVLAGFQDNLDDLFPHFDLFAQSSHTEGLPNVLLEAFAAGVPVVATAVGGTPEVIDDGMSGYLVPPGDSTALAGRIIDLLGNDTARREMGSRGQQQVKERFSFPSQAREYRRLFERLAPAPRSSASEIDCKPQTG